MNGYKAFYNGKEIEVEASTQLEARNKAVKMFKARKTYQVTTILCEVNGEQVIHKPLY